MGNHCDADCIVMQVSRWERKLVGHFCPLKLEIGHIQAYSDRRFQKESSTVKSRHKRGIRDTERGRPVSLENLFPRSFTTKRTHFSSFTGSLREAFARSGQSQANAVHFGHHIETTGNQIHADMSARDIVSMLSR